MKNKNNNQNEVERLGGQRSGWGGYIPPIPPPGSATGYIHHIKNNNYTKRFWNIILLSDIHNYSKKEYTSKY